MRLPPGELRVVIIRPNGDNLKLSGIAVEVDLKEVSAVILISESGEFAALLKRYPLDKTANFVIVGVEWRVLSRK